MRFNFLPPELLALLLVSHSFHRQRVSANSAVNVALQASFNGPPYILELLSVTLILHCFVSIEADCRAGRQLQKRIVPRIFPSWTESPRGTLRIAVLIKSYIIHFYCWWRTMDTSRVPMHYLRSNSPFRYIRQLLE